MNLYKKNKLLMVCIILVIISSIIAVNFLITKNSDSEIYFKNFINTYKSRNIAEANKYLINKQMPDINQVFSKNIENLNDDNQIEIVNLFADLLYSIDYDVISSKTFLNKSILNINFNYYNLSKHIINIFKNSNSQEIDYNTFANSLTTTKYKISTNLNIELTRKNNQWYVVLSDNLINILTAGLYKNFVI